MSDNNITKDNNYIKIFLRIKPLFKNDLGEANYLKISKDNQSLTVTLSPENESKFHFEKIFNENEKQLNIFQILGKPLCFSFLEGINSTFISYGKKGTGKTYSILGKSIHEIQKESLINGNENQGLYYEYLNNRGILNYCLEYIFNNVYLDDNNKNFDFNFELSYIEIFDSCVIDYFNNLNFDNKKNFNFVNLFNNKNSLNFCKLKISSPDEAFILLSKVEEIRKYICNEINLKEDSGNVMISINLEKTCKQEKRIFKSDFNFVEIATNFNLKNNKYNLSVKRTLETFSYIINQLSDGVKRENIIYENSILTDIMKESLGGNSKTSILVNISPYNTYMVDSFQSITLSSKMRNIKNNPIVNEIIKERIDYSYYIGILDKKERLKSEKNYLLNYLANINANFLEKNVENGSKKIILRSDKEKEECLKKISDDINEMNLKIEKIDNDINIFKSEKEINLDKYSKINLSLFIQNKDITEQNSCFINLLNSKKEKDILINQYSKENINLDSSILKHDLIIKEENLKREEENFKLNKEISITQLQIENKDIILNNLKGINHNLKEENMHKNKIKIQLEKMKKELNDEKTEKIKKIEDIKVEQDKIFNKSKRVKEEILDKNSQFQNCQKNLNQYNEYQNITINYFKKFYDENSKKEILNNNKFFDIQKYLPEKEKKLKQISIDIDDINKKKMKLFYEQDTVQKEIFENEENCKKLEQKNKLYNNQINNLNSKISILTTNINFPNINSEIKEDIETFKDKNIDLNNSIISYELSNNNDPNDLLLFKNNFNVNLDESNKEQLLLNKKKLLEQEQNENIILKDKKNVINNEIYKFKINQMKLGNNKDKTHSQYNLVKIEENMDKINEKEKLITNYQNHINSNYKIIQDYLKENIPDSSDENNEFPLKKFKNIFSKFIEKSKQIDSEFEIIKKEFKEREEEYRSINKEIISISLESYPLLKNYEEVFNNKDNINNDSILDIKNKNENNHKRITMIDNTILSDVKNISIYNGIYSKKRKLNDLNIITGNEENLNRRIKMLFSKNLSENKNINYLLNENNNKNPNLIKSLNKKENKMNSDKNETNFKTQIVNNKSKIKCLYKSPDKITYTTKKNYKYNNMSNYNSNFKFTKKQNKN